MASEASRKKAEELCTEEHQSWHTPECGQCANLAAALDAARAEGAMLADQEVYKRGLLVGAERERWACWNAVHQRASAYAERVLNFTDALMVDAVLVAKRDIASRGPMRGPEEDK